MEKVGGEGRVGNTKGGKGKHPEGKKQCGTNRGEKYLVGNRPKVKKT